MHLAENLGVIGEHIAAVEHKHKHRKHQKNIDKIKRIMPKPCVAGFAIRRVGVFARAGRVLFAAGAKRPLTLLFLVFCLFFGGSRQVVEPLDQNFGFLGHRVRDFGRFGLGAVELLLKDFC